MRLLEQVQIKLDWTDIHNLKPRHKDDLERSNSGKHVTDILRAIAFRTGRLKWSALKDGRRMLTSDGNDARDHMPLVMALGLAIEEFFLPRLYPDMQYPAPPVARDGIVGHPDGRSLLDFEIRRALAIEECKVTYKSRRTRPNLDNEWMFHQQGMSYCNMDEMRPMHARFHVFYLQGDYRTDFEPEYWRYLYEYSSTDLEDNWRMMTTNRDIQI
jgi:hypothetical protein